jgi:dephospho-CoA kinase
MYCIGLTGNIASGKSTINQLFKELGVTVISADYAARELTNIHQPALKAIKEHFGLEIINNSGELNRPALREKIFSNPEQRIWLERLLHPLIRQYIRDKIQESDSPYTLVEIPLLNDRAAYPYLNRVLLVIANSQEQIERVMARDHCSRKHAEAILAIQSNEETKRKFADDIIYNDGSLKDLTKKIEILHHQYLQLAKQKS